MKTKTKIILGFIITIVIFILSGIITTLFVKSTGVSSIYGPFVYFPTILLITFIAIKWGIKKAELKFNWSISAIQGKSLLHVIITTLIIAFIAGTFLWWIVEKAGVEMGERHEIFSKTPLLMLVSTIIFAPLGEEILFRGFFQNMLEGWKKYGIKLPMLRLSLPVILSAVMFSLFHLMLFSSGMGSARVMLTLITSFFVGLTAGFFQEKHENFVYAVIVHITANTLPIAIQIING